MNVYREFETDYGKVHIYHKGKDELDVSIPNQISRLIQVHGDNLIQAQDHLNLEGDAQYTRNPDLVLEVRTADCIPLILWNEKSPLLLAIHSGWKGSLLEISSKSIQSLEKHNSMNPLWEAWIGPSISEDVYEVKNDMSDQFPTMYQKFFIQRNEKITFDNVGLVKSQLRSFPNIFKIYENDSICNYKNTSYYSHRRGDKERNFTFAWMSFS
jgi:hypothetical protein